MLISIIALLMKKIFSAMIFQLVIEARVIVNELWTSSSRCIKGAKQMCHYWTVRNLDFIRFLILHRVPLEWGVTTSYSALI